jgi:hypothetical protein
MPCEVLKETIDRLARHEQAVSGLPNSEAVMGLGTRRFFSLNIVIRRMLQYGDELYRSSYFQWRLLIDLSSICSNRESVDPKDKIFALTGVFQKIGIRLPDPDYGKPVTVVYQEATKAILDTRTSLMVLYLVRPSTLPGLASWVVDWSQDTPGLPIVTLLIHERGYAATSDSIPQFHFSNNGNLLHLVGKVIGDVAAVEPPVPKSGDAVWEAVEAVRVLKRWVNIALMQDAYPGDGKNFEALFHTLCDHTRPKRADISTERQDFGAFLQWLFIVENGDSCCEDLAWPLIIGQAAEAMRRSTSQNGEFDRLVQTPEFRFLAHLTQHGRCLDFHMRVASLATEGKLVVTGNAMIGRGPVHTQVGDVIALISGMHVPMCLRPVATRYVLVGPAFVYGIMQGELWSSEQGDLRELIIE